MTGRPHILFVDDEPRVLGGLRRMLRTNRDRWDMSFAEGGEEALAIMRARPCELIISDYRMPGMNGAQLLEQVREEFPGAARVILSGQTNEENVLRMMVLAHEFLTKPSTPEQLVATVERLIDVRAPSDGTGRRRDIAVVESLPSAPNTLIELVAALDSDDASAQSVGTVIERDPAATAKVLHLVNSSAYSAGRTVSNVGQAVALLGLHTVRGLVLVHDLIQTFEVDSAIPAEWIGEFTVHSVETSRLCRLLAAGADWESQAFTAGLLHEVGQLVLASSRPATFGDVVRRWRDPGAEAVAGDGSLGSAEQAAFGVSHVTVGVDLLGLWGLPTPVIEAVAGHTAGVRDGGAADPCSTVALAHLLLEEDVGPACGSPDSVATVDEGELDESVLKAVTRWRRERSLKPG